MSFITTFHYPLKSIQIIQSLKLVVCRIEILTDGGHLELPTLNRRSRKVANSIFQRKKSPKKIPQKSKKGHLALPTLNRRSRKVATSMFSSIKAWEDLESVPGWIWSEVNQMYFKANYRPNIFTALDRRLTRFAVKDWSVENKTFHSLTLG